MAGKPKQLFLQVEVGLTSSIEFLALASEIRDHLPESDRAPSVWIGSTLLLLMRTWEAFLVKKPDGCPLDIPPDIIEEWAGFRGTRGAFWAAFSRHFCATENGRLVLRGWTKRYGKIATHRTKDAERKRLAREGSALKSTHGPTNHEHVQRMSARMSTGHEAKKQPSPLDCPQENTPKSNRVVEENYYPSPNGEGRTDAFASSPPCPLDMHPDMHPDIAGASPHAERFDDADLELLDADLDLSPPEPHASGTRHSGLAIAPLPAAAPAAARPARTRQAPRAPAAPDGVSAATESPAATGKREPREPKYPHFPHEVRAELMAVWRDQVMPLREDQRGRFVKAFAGWFAQPESERPAHLPSNAEVVDALRVMLEARKECYGSQHLHVPNYAAERIGLVVEILRETFDDPFQRLNRLERALALKPILRHDAPPPGRR